MGTQHPARRTPAAGSHRREATGRPCCQDRGKVARGSSADGTGYQPRIIGREAEAKARGIEAQGIAQGGTRPLKHLGVVEGQWRHFVEGKPAGIVGIVAARLAEP